jgi:tetratricopeptide (TPR) repeat protein
MPPHAYKYDAALSFAGEDRKLAESLSSSLQERGLSVFYDAHREAYLWGKSSREFEKIYGPQSRYVIPLVSKHYVKKPWTRFEFDVALREQERRRGEFILAIRLDDSLLLGLPNDVIRQDARKKSAEELAELFAAKCHPLRPGTTARNTGAAIFALTMLRPSARRALGLIATAAVPLSLPYFEHLFPKHDWRGLVAKFRRAGLVQAERSVLLVSKGAFKVLREDEEEQKSLNRQWIDRLGPLETHLDTGALLFVHLLAAGRLEDAARVVVNIAQYPNLGWWNTIYVTLLSVLARRRVFAKLGRQMQIEVLNGLGICLSQAGQYREAMKYFEDLRRLSKKYHNTWGVGQSFINAGVAASKNGDEEAGERLYWNAVKHGKRSKDQMLRGRALGNLSQLFLKKDIGRAKQLLEESLEAKAAAKDSFGLVAGLLTRGSLASARGDSQLAARWYKQSAQDALRLGLDYEYALSTYNYGRALQDSGKIRAAMHSYLRARRLAIPDDYTDILLLSLNALGASAFAGGEYRDAAKWGRDLLMIAKRTKNAEYELGALHMLAMSSLASGRKSESERDFETAIRAARKRRADDWVVRCLVDSTRGASKGDVSNPDLVRLRQIARMEASHRRHRIAWEIWGLIARMSAFGKAERDASDAFIATERCLSHTPNFVRERLDLYRNWYGWAWSTRRYDDAIDLLKKLEYVAQRSHVNADAIAAMDQRGVCLQELGKHTEAEVLHRAAVAASKRLSIDAQLERSLNNLGEALRQLGHHAEAVRVLRESEKIASRSGRYDATISSAHNRALALESLGRVKESEQVLRQCRDHAARRRLWYEYVRAWEALANLTSASGKRTAALRLYRKAQRECRKRRVRELAPRIALNFARLLRVEDKSKIALRTLEPFRSQFDDFVNSHLYFGTLAELYEQTGRIEEASRTWDIAKTRAESAKDREYASYCAAQGLGAKPRTTELSQPALLRALKTERGPERRANLLIQRLAILLNHKSTTESQATFEEILHLCTQHHLHEHKSQLYLLIGDHDVMGTYEEKLNAFRAYTMAMMSSVEGKLPSFGEVASRIVLKIVSANSPVSEDQVGRLLRDLKKCLTAEAPKARRILRLLLWPFAVAVRLSPLRGQPHRLLAAVQRVASAKSMNRYLAGVSANGSLAKRRS